MTSFSKKVIAAAIPPAMLSAAVFAAEYPSTAPATAPATQPTTPPATLPVGNAIQPVQQAAPAPAMPGPGGIITINGIRQ